MSPSRRRATARGGSPPRYAAWQVAHAESFACRGSVRDTVRGRAAHPARWGHRALPPLPTQNSHAQYSYAITHRALPGRWSGATAHGGFPPSRLAPYRLYTRVVRTRPPKNLCAPIHPAQKLFVPLCVKNIAPAMPHAHRPWGLPTLPARAPPPDFSKICRIFLDILLQNA